MLSRVFVSKFANAQEIIAERKRIAMSTFSDRLDALLHEYDMNRSQLSRRLNVDVSTVHRWFKRGSIPNQATINRIANIFGVDERYLYGTIDDPIGAPEVEPFTRSAETNENESAIDDELVRTIKSLTPAQLQRVRDFLAGLKG